MDDEERPTEERAQGVSTETPDVSPEGSEPETAASGAGSDFDATATGEEGADDDGFVMSEADEKLAEANDRYIRLLADFDNYRKRAQKDRIDSRASANEDMVAEVLPVLDNLERAIAASREGTGGPEGFEGVLKGVELTLKMFTGALSRYGVERIRVIGKPFDPNRHEAVAQVETDDLDADTVAEELLPGYTMNGRVIRASRVTVAKPKAAQSPDAGAREEEEAAEKKEE